MHRSALPPHPFSMMSGIDTLLFAVQSSQSQRSPPATPVSTLSPPASISSSPTSNPSSTSNSSSASSSSSPASNLSSPASISLSMFQLQNGFQNQSSQGFQTFISGKGQKRGRRVRDPVTSNSSSNSSSSSISNSSSNFSSNSLSNSSSNPSSSSSPNSLSNSSSNSSFNISSNPGTDQTPARSYIHHEQPDQTDTGYNKRIRISDDIYDSLQEFGKRHQTKNSSEILRLLF